MNKLDIVFLENCSDEEFKELNPLLKKMVEVYQKRNFDIQEKEKKEKRLALEKELEILKQSTNYIAPEYSQFDYDKDEMDDNEKDGCCTFSSEEQAKRMINILIGQSYYFGHVLNYTGPGLYIIKPSWKYDCGGEVIYTATYIKEEL